MFEDITILTVSSLNVRTLDSKASLSSNKVLKTIITDVIVAVQCTVLIYLIFIFVVSLHDKFVVTDVSS